MCVIVNDTSESFCHHLENKKKNLLKKNYYLPAGGGYLFCFRAENIMANKDGPISTGVSNN